MTQAELTARVKKLALANNLDYVGIASANGCRTKPNGVDRTTIYRAPEQWSPWELN